MLLSTKARVRKMRYYSVKMRASKEGKHISGGERIVEREALKEVINSLIERPRDFDFLNIKVKLVQKLNYIDRSLKIENCSFPDTHQANAFAIEIIHKYTGIDKVKIENFINLIHVGASDRGDVMRGAMLVDTNGNRLERDRNRGVRTTGVDFEDREKVRSKLIKKGFTDRTLDALAIATKNLNYPDILGEYCISDDPDYQYGYVAVKGSYIRIYPLKDKGNDKGGRIYFVKKEVDLDRLYNYLEEEEFLIRELGEVL